MKKESALREVLEILRHGQLKKLFVGDTENTLIQFFRYIFVGGAATVVDWGTSLFFFYIVFGQRFAVASNALSFVLGLVTNYLLSIAWIFRSNESGKTSRLMEFLGFAVIGLVGLGLTMGITRLFEIWLSNVTSAYQILGKVVSTAVAFFWNFFARKYLLFTKKKPKGDA